MPDKINVHIIAGPTASGKSARALEIAVAQGGVVGTLHNLQKSLGNTSRVIGWHWVGIYFFQSDIRLPTANGNASHD